MDDAVERELTVPDAAEAGEYGLVDRVIEERQLPRRAMAGFGRGANGEDGSGDN